MGVLAPQREDSGDFFHGGPGGAAVLVECVEVAHGFGGQQAARVSAGGREGGTGVAADREVGDGAVDEGLVECAEAFAGGGPGLAWG
jgi:hypothetical protein